MFVLSFLLQLAEVVGGRTRGDDFTVICLLTSGSGATGILPFLAMHVLWLSLCCFEACFDFAATLIRLRLWPCAILDCIAPQAYQRGNVSHALLRGVGGTGCTVTSGLSTVHRPSASLHGIPITLLIYYLFQWSFCSFWATSRILNTPSSVPT